MHWTDDVLVLGTRLHGESGLLVEVLSREHGRHLGLVRGGAGRRLRGVLQPGNAVRATWAARLSEHLGTFTVEPIAERTGRLIGSAVALHGLGLLAAHLRLLPERDPHPGIHDAAEIILTELDDPLIAPALMVRFELALLDDLGFGLDLATCAATGVRDDLIYVSPRSGRAVSREAGAPYADRLLPLPDFLTGNRSSTPTSEDVEAGFKLTGFFLEHHIYGPRGLPLPEARDSFLAAVRRART